MKLNEIKRYIIQSGKNADKNLLISFNEFINISKAELESFSPVDKGDFKKSWKVLGTIKSQNRISTTIESNSPYAAAIEYGSAPGSKPWPNPGEKTVMSNGRIFSTQAVGGVIGKVFDDDKINSFVKELANTITKAFK